MRYRGKEIILNGPVFPLRPRDVRISNGKPEGSIGSSGHEPAVSEGQIGEEIVLNGPAFPLRLAGSAGLSNEKSRETNEVQLRFAPWAISVVIEDGPGEAAGQTLTNEGYNSDEPRIPAGQPGGGQWTSGDERAKGSGNTPKAEGRAPSATERSEAPLAQVLQALKAGGQHPTSAQLEAIGKACDAWQRFVVSHGVSPFVAGEEIQNIVHNFYNPGSGPNAGSEGVLGFQEGQSAGAGAGGIVAGAIVGATQSRRTTEVPGQAPPAPSAAKTLPGGSLKASEDAGGHLLAKHTGKTDGQLMSRAMTDPKTSGVVSSFFDQPTAEAAASQAIEANAANIAKWVGSGKTKPLKIYGTLNRSVGKMVTREGVSTATSSSVFVLVRDATSPTGYFIRTGYPTTR